MSSDVRPYTYMDSNLIASCLALNLPTVDGRLTANGWILPATSQGMESGMCGAMSAGKA